MASKEESVFVPISLDGYKRNKVNCLQAQLQIKQNLLFIKKIEELKQLKEDCRSQILRKLSEIKKEINKLEIQLPKSASVSEKAGKIRTSKKYPTKLDEELKFIQDKLRALSQ